MRAGIPYRIYGGLRFYDRKEVKDIVAYLRCIVNPADDVSLRRTHALRASSRPTMSSAAVSASDQTSAPTGAVPNSQLPTLV